MALYRAKEVWTGTLASSIPDGTTTSFTLTSSSGLTNGETYVFTIDRVDANGTKTPSKKEVIVGTVSGSNVINCQRGVEGTAQAHSAGAIVEIIFTAKHWNDFIDSYKTQHRENGTHSKIQGLDNNQAITQKDSAGTERSILNLNSSNVLEIGDSNLAGVKFNTPLVNNTALTQKDSGGTARDVAKLDSSDVLTLGNTTTPTKIKAGSNTTDGHTVPNVADDTVALLSATQTLSNKTIDSSNSFSIIKPAADGTSAIKITKANGSTTILNIDSINNIVNIGTMLISSNLRVLSSIWEFGFDQGVSPRIGRLWYMSDGTGYGFSIGRKAVSDSSYSDYVYIKDGGNVGIGTTSPGYKLDVNGQCHASSFPTSSDKRFKENVKEIDNALEKVKKLRGVYFNWNKFYRETLRVDETEDTEIGVIAQEIKEVIPEVVTTFEREVNGKKETYHSVEYARLSALLINAIKELAGKVENLEKKYGEINKSRT